VVTIVVYSSYSARPRAAIQIKLSFKEQYIALCKRTPALPVFLQHWWMDAVCDQWDVALAQKGDNITAVWPYALIRKLGVNLLRTPALTPYTGPYAIIPPDVKESGKDSYEHDAFTELLTHLPQAPVWYLSVTPGIRQAGIFRAQGAQVQVQQTFLIDLQREPSVILASFNESLRRHLKAAANELTITEQPELLSDLYQYQQHTLNTKEVMQPHSLAQMQRLYDAGAAHRSTAVYAASENGITQAIIWTVWDAHCCYYLMGAKNPAAANQRAIAALLWHAMQQARDRGNIIFDLEGSMDPGVERFFRGFGGQRELYLVLRKNKSFIWQLKELMR
jgi:Acetyltransferase (GNAT) domain